MKNHDESLINILREHWQLLMNSLKTLKLSVEKCKQIGKKEAYTFSEMESFDSLTSKFGRTADMYTQKVLRTCWMLLHEPFVPFIDMINQCEKMELIKSADTLVEIRDLRNQIAHEYIPEAIQELVPDVIEYSSHLEKNIHCTKKFLSARKWLLKNVE